ncbi:MAG: PAS domain S-box protein [Acidobacteria bacterium]|nr:PAS domain S-box protein [Acidobacteriota bacterium]MCW5950157.1 PAS domain S-box protein [Pyrinomonadaceae bacterium]
MKSKVLTSWSLLWLIATVLVVAVAALSLVQRASHTLPPTDGVAWVVKSDGLYAEQVLPGFAAYRAGVSRGDRLIAISLEGESPDEVRDPASVQMFLEAAGIGGTLTYHIQKTSYSFLDNYYVADLRNIDSLPRWTPSVIFLLVVGLVWLTVGIFVLFKQGSIAPFVLHFATLCVVAFAFHTYKPIGIGQDLDLAVGLLNTIALAFFAPLFLHFCIRYPVRTAVFDEKRWRTYALYAPAAIMSIAAVSVTLLQALFPTAGFADGLAAAVDAISFYTLLDRIVLYHFIAGVSAGAGFLIWRFFKNRQPMVRQRLKWAMWGTIAAVTPIILIEAAIRFGVDLPKDDVFTAALRTLPLALIPLSFGHSVVRYRLMDVDVVVRRALVYALTTIAIAMMIGVVALGLVFLAVGNNLSTTEITLRALIAVIAMAAIVLLSEPLKKFLQERADRFFYGERYDMREGLLDFGKTLSAATALEPLLDALIDRLKQVLNVEKVAVFIEDESSPAGYRLGRSAGLTSEFQIPVDFKATVRQKSAAKGVVRADEIEPGEDVTEPRTMPAPSELHYFVPCVARGKMVAILGLGRAGDGSLLTSEDLEILKTISGYIAVAIENSRLYEQQQRHAEEMALLKEFNESIVESVNVGLLAVDEDGRIIRCNTTFESMLGLDREEAVGRMVENVFDASFASSIGNLLGKNRWHLTEIRNAYKVHTFDAVGNSLILNVAIAPLRSVSNTQTGAIIVLENVTSRVKLEETLQQSEKLSSIGLLAAGVAHEVNTPLTGVSSYTQMLLGMVPETDPKHELLRKMHRQTERASNIVGNLLNFSRMGSSTDFGEVDLNKLLNDTLQLLEPQLRKSNVTVEKKYAEELPAVHGNAGKLQQVFTNLVLNARDAMAAGGNITLVTASDGNGKVIVEVADTGDGIPEENLSKIFDPFFTTKGVGNGTGLGLAVSYGIVQEHGGSIEAKSKYGVGSTFRLMLPTASSALKRAVS